jgi:hypothetical protein
MLPGFSTGMLLGASAGEGEPGSLITYMHAATATQSAHTSTCTVSDLSAGTAKDGRRRIVAVAWTKSSINAHSLSSAAWLGKTGTALLGSNNSGLRGCRTFSFDFDESDGASGNLVLTWSGSNGDKAVRVAVFDADDYRGLAHHFAGIDTTANVGVNASVTVTGSAKPLWVIATFVHRNNAAVPSINREELDTMTSGTVSTSVGHNSWVGFGLIESASDFAVAMTSNVDQQRVMEVVAFET